MSGVVVNRCDFTVGQYIGGLYRVDLVLGEGSFGKVFKVTGPRFAGVCFEVVEIVGNSPRAS